MEREVPCADDGGKSDGVSRRRVPSRPSGLPTDQLWGNCRGTRNPWPTQVATRGQEGLLLRPHPATEQVPAAAHRQSRWLQVSLSHTHTHANILCPTHYQTLTKQSPLLTITCWNNRTKVTQTADGSKCFGWNNLEQATPVKIQDKFNKLCLNGSVRGLLQDLWGLTPPFIDTLSKQTGEHLNSVRLLCNPLQLYHLDLKCSENLFPVRHGILCIVYRVYAGRNKWAM